LSDKGKIPQDILELFESLPSKRGRVLVKHIFERGQVTTEELEQTYGYAHPPRAARDVREAGIPLETHRIRSEDGRIIAAYKFGDLSKIQHDRLGGRHVFPKEFRDTLHERSGGKCDVCLASFEARCLQIDHRVPYEVSGDEPGLVRDPQAYMLLCGSCNRAKSWSCEHCPNWLLDKSAAICLRCYWADPDNHSHLALREMRRTDMVWTEEEVATYERLKNIAVQARYRIPDYVKKIVENHVRDSQD
jgi:hypothetical protein